jgi:hypothetical protein
MIAQMTRAVLFAIATVATLVGFRASRSARRGSTRASHTVLRKPAAQPHLMAKLDQFARPVMRGAARFDADQARCQSAFKFDPIMEWALQGGQVGFQ